MNRPGGEHPSSPLPRGGGWRIGVFDSGVGGLSILRSLRETLPNSELLYVADSGHAPYGERDVAHIVERSCIIAAFLREQGAQMLVLACNTATAAAVAALRDRYADWPIIGVEPGLKPAAAATRNGRISIMATAATLASDKFEQLLQAYGQRNGQALHIHKRACPGLAGAIELGDLDAPELIELVKRYCEDVQAHGSDTVVLGCTHYPFVRHHIEAALGRDVTLIDTTQAIARRAAALCDGLTPRVDGRASIHLWSSGDPRILSETARRWLGWDAQAQAWDQVDQPRQASS